MWCKLIFHHKLTQGHRGVTYYFLNVEFISKSLTQLVLDFYCFLFKISFLRYIRVQSQRVQYVLFGRTNIKIQKNITSINIIFLYSFQEIIFKLSQFNLNVTILLQNFLVQSNFFLPKFFLFLYILNINILKI